MRRLLLPTLSGVLYFLSWIGFGIWPLAFVCFLPLLWSLRDATPRQALWLGAWMGFGTPLGGYTWIMHVLRVFASAPAPLAFLGYLLVCVAQGFLFGVMSLALVWVGRRTRWPATALLPLARVGTEFAYPLLFQSYTGVALMPVLPLVQIADLGGPLILSALQAVVNGALFDAMEAWLTGRGGRSEDPGRPRPSQRRRGRAAREPDGFGPHPPAADRRAARARRVARDLAGGRLQRAAPAPGRHGRQGHHGRRAGRCHRGRHPGGRPRRVQQRGDDRREGPHRRPLRQDPAPRLWRVHPGRRVVSAALPVVAAGVAPDSRPQHRSAALEVLEVRDLHLLRGHPSRHRPVHPGGRRPRPRPCAGELDERFLVRRGTRAGAAPHVGCGAQHRASPLAAAVDQHRDQRVRGRRRGGGPEDRREPA